MARGATTTAEAGPGRARWVFLTLPLAPLALFAYGAFEWLFFATKPSFLTVLPFAEQLEILFRAPLPFVGPVLLCQLGATLLSLLLFPRLRWLGVVPAAALLAALVLALVHNFLYVLAGAGLTSNTALVRVVHGTVLAAGFVLWLRKLAVEMPSHRGWILWAAATPILLGALFAAPETPDAAAALPTLPRGGANVLILSIDGVDAGRLSAYGYRAATSPFMESLAPETLFCENAFSNAQQTYTSQTSLLTGKLPFTTKVIVPPSILRGDDAVQHLPAIFRRSGYRTLQLSMRHFGDAEDANLQEGFDLTNYRWENRLSTQRVEQLYDSARPFRLAVIDRLDGTLARLFGTRPVSDDFARVIGGTSDPFWSDAKRVDAFFSFVDGGRGPWFAHVHLLDTHSANRFTRGPLRVGTDLYDNQLRDADEEVRRVFDGLRRRAQLERTVVVVTSDHPRKWLFGPKARIPLMIRFPERRHARREPRNAQMLDVAPTVLDFLGVAPPRWLEGDSLLRPENLRDDRPIFASAEVRASELPRPPHYGIREAGLVAGSGWYSLDLQTGRMRRGAIEGHTRPSPPLPGPRARALLEEMLVRRGLR
ncbi:MAG TPA: sulfatase-like hydrolase/transferase [Thermoanaerobaculia bacterium]|jgi:hypothetical protein